MSPLVGEDGRVYVIDIQHDLAKRVKGLARGVTPGNIEIIAGDLEKVGGSRLADQSIDVALASNIIFQLEEKPTMFKEAKRVLKPKGTLILIDWSDSFGGLGPQPQDVVTQQHARKLAEEAGFVFAKDFIAGAHHWGIVMHLPK